MGDNSMIIDLRELDFRPQKRAQPSLGTPDRFTLIWGQANLVTN